MTAENKELGAIEAPQDGKTTPNQSNGIAFAGKTFPLAQMLATAQLTAICAAIGMPFVQEEL